MTSCHFVPKLNITISFHRLDTVKCPWSHCLVPKNFINLISESVRQADNFRFDTSIIAQLLGYGLMMY